jgi:glucan phosphoethanolaminetransferase (alkaline phosphatase superfamily)
MGKVSRRRFLKDAVAGAVGVGLAPEALSALAATQHQSNASAGSSAATQKKSNQPNIILICCDQFRADVCRREGFALDTTPFMDSLARSGVWFDKAYCASPSCVPSRQAMWTGRWPTATGIESNGNVDETPQFKAGLLEAIESQGYKTDAIGKTYHSYIR